MRRSDRSKCRHGYSKAGFSLLEVITAMAVVGIGFVGLYSGLTYGFARIRYSRESLRATQILMEKMETVRLYNWDQITSTNFIPRTFTATYQPTTDTNSPGVVYHGKLTITNVGLAANYDDNMRLVTVSLTWTSASTPCSRSFTTHVSENGIFNYIYPQHYH